MLQYDDSKHIWREEIILKNFCFADAEFLVEWDNLQMSHLRTGPVFLVLMLWLEFLHEMKKSGPDGNHFTHS